MACTQADIASAQTPRLTAAFIEGAVLADHDPTRFGPTGTVAAGGISVGVLRTTKYSVRLDIEVPTWFVTEYTVDQPVGDHVERGSFRQTRRTVAYSALLGRDVHLQRRLDVTLLAGAAATDRQSRDSGAIEFLTDDG